MNKPIHPAVAEHVMEENERLRGLLTTFRVSLNLDDTEYGLSQQEKRKLAADIDAELSRQPEPMCETMQRPKAECGCPDCGSSLIDWPTAEPTDTFTAVDMATAAAQGFRDGQAAVEPAPAQDEREAFEECWAVRNADDEGNIGNKPLRSLVDQQHYRGDAVNGSWVWFQRGAAWQRTRPAQTEQQPEQSEPNRRTLQWVVDRWHAEVANRPLVNVHRRTLDSTWRQMIRHLGEDDVVLLGPRHDDMLDASGNPLPQYAAALNATQQENSHE